MSIRIVPALIVGGGPAGAAAAIRLAEGGVFAELIERSAGPRDVVCGGFVGWDAIAALERLGVDAAALGARPITRLRLVTMKRIVETKLPQAAAGLSRRCLDEALLERAAALGAKVRKGVTARGGEGRTIRLDGGELLAAETLFLATGKHELRGLARDVPAGRGAGAVGLRASFRPGAADMARLAGFIELHPFDGGYAGLLLQEDGSANLCMSVSAARLRRAGGIDGLLEELLREAPRLAAYFACVAAKWISVSNVPYGWRARATTEGLFRIGDQAAVIASLAGDGIAIALTSGIAAAEAHLAGTAAPDFQQAFARTSARPLKLAEALRWAAERSGPRRLLTGLAGFSPGLARWAASSTRIAS